jgi:DNA polymerase-3 subunit delta'
MIKKYLENHYNIGKLHNSYLINSDLLEKSFTEVKEFISNTLLPASSIENNADYICVRREDAKVKSISIDQIRNMQNFLHKTSVINGKKVAIIYAAEQMNLNAANSCLKILEDTPKNSYIFLLTTNAASILPTIRSRCAKINYRYNEAKDKLPEEKFLSALHNKTDITDKFRFITEFVAKDRDLWQSFTAFAQELMAKFCKESININCGLSKLEYEVFMQFKSRSPQALQIKYDKIRKISDDTSMFDLDIKASYVILIDQFQS